MRSPAGRWLLTLFLVLRTNAAAPGHIEAVENGLLPAVLIKGRPVPHNTITERMKTLNVRGVSIAVDQQLRSRVGEMLWFCRSRIEAPSRDHNAVSSRVDQQARCSRGSDEARRARQARARSGHQQLPQDVEAA